MNITIEKNVNNGMNISLDGKHLGVFCETLESISTFTLQGNINSIDKMLEFMRNKYPDATLYTQNDNIGHQNKYTVSTRKLVGYCDIHYPDGSKTTTYEILETEALKTPAYYDDRGLGDVVDGQTVNEYIDHNNKKVHVSISGFYVYYKLYCGVENRAYPDGFKTKKAAMEAAKRFKAKYPKQLVYARPMTYTTWK